MIAARGRLELTVESAGSGQPPRAPLDVHSGGSVAHEGEGARCGSRTAGRGRSLVARGRTGQHLLSSTSYSERWRRVGEPNGHSSTEIGHEHVILTGTRPLGRPIPLRRRRRHHQVVWPIRRHRYDSAQHLGTPVRQRCLPHRDVRQCDRSPLPGRCLQSTVHERPGDLDHGALPPRQSSSSATSERSLSPRAWMSPSLSTTRSPTWSAADSRRDGALPSSWRAATRRSGPPRRPWSCSPTAPISTTSSSSCSTPPRHRPVSPSC